MRPRATVALLGGVVLLWGCASVDYYLQSATGHMSVMVKRRDIAALIEDPTTAPALRQRFERVQIMRRFAVDELALPSNDSYRQYADIERDFVVWSVTATPELSLEPERWCYLVVGCLSYRGFYSLAAASAFADDLRARGLDVYVAPVRAYSTLGWFDDPLLNTLVNAPEWDVAGVIFHELAHQQLYIAGDTAFNEAYALTVQLEGERRWLQQHGDALQRDRYRRAQARRAAFLELVRGTRVALVEVYGSAITVAQKRTQKQRLFRELRARYQALRGDWGGYRGYDRWFAQDLNNAKLALVATYNGLVPQFQALLAAVGGDLRSFHASVAAIGDLDYDERRRALSSAAAAASLAESPASCAAGGLDVPSAYACAGVRSQASVPQAATRPHLNASTMSPSSSRAG